MYNFKNETCLPAGDHLASMTVCFSISLSHYFVSLTHTHRPPSTLQALLLKALTAPLFLPQECHVCIADYLRAVSCPCVLWPSAKTQSLQGQEWGLILLRQTLWNIYRVIINYINICFQSLLESNYILPLTLYSCDFHKLITGWMRNYFLLSLSQFFLCTFLSWPSPVMSGLFPGFLSTVSLLWIASQNTFFRRQ